MRLSSSSLAGSEIRPGSCARATNLWGRSVRLFQALYLLVTKASPCLKTFKLFLDEIPIVFFGTPIKKN